MTMEYWRRQLPMTMELLSNKHFMFRLGRRICKRIMRKLKLLDRSRQNPIVPADPVNYILSRSVDYVGYSVTVGGKVIEKVDMHACYYTLLPLIHKDRKAIDLVRCYPPKANYPVRVCELPLPLWEG